MLLIGFLPCPVIGRKTDCSTRNTCTRRPNFRESVLARPPIKPSVTSVLLDIARSFRHCTTHGKNRLVVFSSL